MKKFFYLFLLPLCMGLQACGGDDAAEVQQITNINIPGKTGPTAEDLAKYVNVTVSLDENEKLWTANIQSTLPSVYPNKDIKYGMRADIEVRKDSWNGYTDLTARAKSGKGVFEDVYAEASGDSYVVSVTNPIYVGMSGKGEISGKTGLIDEIDENWAEIESIRQLVWDIKKHIEEGRATEVEIELLKGYEARLNERARLTEGLDYLCTTVVKVFVEMDEKQYVVKSVNHSVRTPLNREI